MIFVSPFLLVTVFVAAQTLPTKDAAKTILNDLLSTNIVSHINGTCDSNIHMMWTAQVGSSIYATPVIADTLASGRKSILVSTMTHYFEALDGITGEDVGRFPFVHPHFKSRASPVSIDIDRDGVPEWMVATYHGQLLFFDNEGKPLADKTIALPPLVVAKSQPTRGPTRASRPKADEMESLLKKFQSAVQVLKQRDARESNLNLGSDGQLHAAHMTFNDSKPQDVKVVQGARQAQGDSDDIKPSQNDGNAVNDVFLEGEGVPEPDMDLDNEYARYYDRYYADEDLPYEYDSVEDRDAPVHVTIGADGWLSDEARASMDLIFHPDLFESAATMPFERDMFTPRVPPPNIPSDNGTHVVLDPHILSTPVVSPDLSTYRDAIIHVTYFMEDENGGVGHPNRSMYLVSALVVVDVAQGTVSLIRPLSQSSMLDAHPSYGLTAPLVCNLDLDGFIDVVVASADGELHALDLTGKEKVGWPVRLGPLAGSPIAVDVNGDGYMDVCVGDLDGYLVCLNAKGHELLRVNVGGPISDSPSAGDVDGDGIIDIVVGTTTGIIVAIDTFHQKPVRSFPIQTMSPILSPPLLVNLNGSSTEIERRGLHVIVPSHDGFLYVVSGTRGCLEIIDIGEKSYSMVLADDVNGNGWLDLVVSTMSGSVMVYETSAPFHPLKQWTSRNMGFNRNIASEGYMGIFVEPSSRVMRDVRGDFFNVVFTIEDHRRGLHTVFSPRYIVQVVIGTHLEVYRVVLTQAKTYAIRVPTPDERVYAPVRVLLYTPELIRFEDVFSLSFNMHFMETIKFVLIIPFALWCLALAQVRKEHERDDIQYPIYGYENF